MAPHPVLLSRKEPVAIRIWLELERTAYGSGDRTKFAPDNTW